MWSETMLPPRGLIGFSTIQNVFYHQIWLIFWRNLLSVIKTNSSCVASCSLNPPGLCRSSLGHTERNKSGMSVDAVYQFYSSISSENVLSFRIKGFFKLPSAHLVRSSSSRMNTLTSISSFALQSVLISTNYLCIYEKYNHKNVWSSAQNRSFISQNHSQNTNILALCDNIHQNNWWPQRNCETIVREQQSSICQPLIGQLGWSVYVPVFQKDCGWISWFSCHPCWDGLLGLYNLLPRWRHGLWVLQIRHHDCRYGQPEGMNVCLIWHSRSITFWRFI